MLSRSLSRFINDFTESLTSSTNQVTCCGSGPAELGLNGRLLVISYLEDLKERELAKSAVWSLLLALKTRWDMESGGCYLECESFRDLQRKMDQDSQEHQQENHEKVQLIVILIAHGEKGNGNICLLEDSRYPQWKTNISGYSFAALLERYYSDYQAIHTYAGQCPACSGFVGQFNLYSTDNQHRRVQMTAVASVNSYSQTCLLLEHRDQRFSSDYTVHNELLPLILYHGNITSKLDSSEQRIVVSHLSVSQRSGSRLSHSADADVDFFILMLVAILVVVCLVFIWLWRRKQLTTERRRKNRATIQKDSQMKLD